MRTHLSLNIVVILALIGLMPIYIPCDANDRKETEQALMNKLGQQFLDAVKANDAKAFQACWLGVPEIKNLLKDDLSGDQLDEVATYFERRDKVVEVVFPLLRRTLEKQLGDIDKLNLTDVQGQVQIVGPRKMSNYFELLMKTESGALIEYRVDDGAFVDEKWHFTDKPETHVSISRDGKKKLISILDVATPEERDAAKAVISRADER